MNAPMPILTRTRTLAHQSRGSKAWASKSCERTEAHAELLRRLDLEGIEQLVAHAGDGRPYRVTPPGQR